MKREELLVERIQLPIPGLHEMRIEAYDEGYDFLDTLLEEWVNGENRFDRTGEALCGHVDNGNLVAVGGLNRDPFVADVSVGRIRRVYVRQAWRHRGLGAALLDSLLCVARANFGTVRLRAENPIAIRLYESRGFVRVASSTATHVLKF